jgi:hypothetical protein
MDQTKISNRVIVVGRTAPASKKTDFREPINHQRPTAQRIVVIRNGELVGSRR